MEFKLYMLMTTPRSHRPIKRTRIVNRGVNKDKGEVKKMPKGDFCPHDILVACQ